MSKLSGRLATALAALTLLVLPHIAVAQATDAWGLTDRDWLTLQGPKLRAAAGFPDSFPRVLAAAQAGDAKAAALLAGAYAVGAGTRVDPAEAFRWAKAAADRGLPFGYYALALQYRDGTGTPRDVGLETAFLEKAVAAGVRPAKLELAVTPQSLENRTADLLPSRRRALLQAAAADGEPNAPHMLSVLDANEKFTRDLPGLPFWKDGRGLIVGHVEFAVAVHPCGTMIGSDTGGVWTIAWGSMNVWRPQATSVLFEGKVGLDNISAYPADATNYPITPELGLVLLENNNAYSPEETRRRFAQIEEDAVRLNALCRAG